MKAKEQRCSVQQQDLRMIAVKVIAVAAEAGSAALGAAEAVAVVVTADAVAVASSAVLVQCPCYDNYYCTDSKNSGTTYAPSDQPLRKKGGTYYV